MKGSPLRPHPRPFFLSSREQTGIDPPQLTHCVFLDKTPQRDPHKLEFQHLRFFFFQFSLLPGLPIPPLRGPPFNPHSTSESHFSILKPRRLSLRLEGSLSPPPRSLPGHERDSVPIQETLGALWELIKEGPPRSPMALRRNSRSQFLWFLALCCHSFGRRNF